MTRDEAIKKWNSAVNTMPDCDDPDTWTHTIDGLAALGILHFDEEQKSEQHVSPHIKFLEFVRKIEGADFAHKIDQYLWQCNSRVIGGGTGPFVIIDETHERNRTSNPQPPQRDSDGAMPLSAKEKSRVINRLLRQAELK